MRITTFNVENMFNRYAFLDTPDPGDYEKLVTAVGLASGGKLLPAETTHIQRNNTALAIEAANPDVLVVEEVENIYTLRNFNEDYLDNAFDRIVLVEGNDPRAIDLGVMIRAGFDARVRAIRTHIDDPLPGKIIERRAIPKFGYKVDNAIFSRDCLEVDLEIGGKVITLLANHLKSQLGNTAECDARRRVQAQRVAELVRDAVTAAKYPIVIGDFNAPPTNNSLEELLSHPALRDPFPKDTWTHYYDGKRTVSRLDYILVDKRLKATAEEPIRKGLTTKCKQYTGERFPGIGPLHTEASDHCPTTVVVEV